MVYNWKHNIIRSEVIHLKKEQNPELKAISQMRIRELIDEFADGSQQEFADETGVAKSSISQYVNKTNAPGNMTAAKIGQRYKINPLWIMGFPVEKNAIDNSAVVDTPSRVVNIVLTSSEAELIEKYRSLDQYGKDTVTSVLNAEYDRCQDEEENSVTIDRETAMKMPLELRLKFGKFLTEGTELMVARRKKK